MAQFNFKAIGTTWQIDIYKDLSGEESANLLLHIKDRIDFFDRAYSRFRDDSIVTKISKESGFFDLPDDAELMFDLYHDLYLKTDGMFTPLIGNLLSDAGYDANYSLQQKNELKAPPSWDEVIEYKYPKLLVKKPTLLDFGAAGKGYLIDLISKVIEENNIFEYCIDAGGDILYKNKTSIRVGLENPENLKQVIGICTLSGGSICGSAGNRRKWNDFTHIINPKTLVSPKEIIAVWVVADRAIIADAIATCLFFVSPSKLRDKYNFEYILVKKDHSNLSDTNLFVEKSEHFPGELFS